MLTAVCEFFVDALNSFVGTPRLKMAEGGGFEPPIRDHRITVFKTASFGRSDNPPEARRPLAIVARAPAPCQNRWLKYRLQHHRQPVVIHMRCHRVGKLADVIVRVAHHDADVRPR